MGTKKSTSTEFVLAVARCGGADVVGGVGYRLGFGSSGLACAMRTSELASQRWRIHGARMLNGEDVGLATGFREKVSRRLFNFLPNRSEAMNRCPAVSGPAMR